MRTLAHARFLSLVLVVSAETSVAQPSPDDSPCSGTAGAVVTSLLAHNESGGVRISWITLSEDKTASFDVGRSSSPTGTFTVVSGQIQAVGGLSMSFYEFLDTSGASGNYYVLSATETSGQRGQCAPTASVDDQPGTTTHPNLQVLTGQNSNYLSANSGGPPYDALIICPDAWASAMAPLRDHWSVVRHHSVLLATLSATGTTKESIRSYIVSRSAVQFVLLVGDTYNRNESTNIIPTWSVQDPSVGALASDASYGDRDGDGLADVAIGRWPAHSSTEATVGVSKSVAYDTQSPHQAYRRRWVGFTYDIDNYNGDLVSGSESREYGDDFLALTPGGHDEVSVQYRASQLTCCGEVRQDSAIAAINAGAHVLWTMGTASSYHDMSHFLWNDKRISGSCGSNLLYAPLDFSRLDPNGACGFWFPLSCDLGGIDRPDLHGLALNCSGAEVWIPPIAEDLLLVPQKGALTWFAPTGPSFPEESHIVGAAILSRLTIDNRVSVGRVCVDAVKALAVARPAARVRAASYSFLGDPTIVMAWGGGDIPTDVTGGTVGVGGRLRISPNPSHSGVKFQFTLASSDNVVLNVYDVAGRRIRTVTKAQLRAGTYTEEWDGRDEHNDAVAAGIYVVRLRSGSRVETQRVVLIR